MANLDLKVRSTSYKASDQSWLASAHGVENGRTITLDLSAFDSTDHYPDGYLPSGLALGKITASGKYGIYDNAALDGTQTMVGHLLFDVVVREDNTTGIAIASLLWHGAVRESRLPDNHGVDSNGKTDVAGRIAYF